MRRYCREKEGVDDGNEFSGGPHRPDYRLVYDGDGKIASICETVGGNTHTFGYDVDGQLVLAKYADNTQQAFGYDASGNLRGLVCNTSYDPETGNLLRLADTLNGTTLCGYDEFGRLNGVTNATRGVNWSCEYDAFGGRVRVTADLADQVGQADKDRYVGLFRIVTKKTTDGGKDVWQNAVEFTPAAETELRKSLDDALKTFDLTRITLEDTNWVVPNPVKGLYYALERTEDLTAGFDVHEYEEATSVSVTFTVNETGNTAGRAFYRLLISACPPE